MYLKSLALSGFKSFGKTTLFEFPTSVTGIVGPNGSGKSNIVEAIRWVLGEQSMKSLRGKKGEDLIFNGSEKIPRLGRAEVKLIFDNSKKQFPFEFEDVVISRRVMRDGTNEYMLNGSLVRLKDIFELLARVGLGSSQHHVISQGEVDRILWASGEERKSMVEDALSLRAFHLKAREAERKLQEVEVNMKQVEAQRRELIPHLKFLNAQAEKMRAHEKYASELKEKSNEYASRGKKTLELQRANFDSRKAPFLKIKEEKEKVVRELQEEIRKEEKEFSRAPSRAEFNKELEEFEEKRRRLDRELGKLEAFSTMRVESKTADIPLTNIVSEMRELTSFVDGLLMKDSFESLKSGLHDIKIRLEAIMRLFSGGKGKHGAENFEAKKKTLMLELEEIDRRILTLKAKKEEDDTVREDIMIDLREREHQLREEEHALLETLKKLREVEFEEERYKINLAEVQRFIEDNSIEIDKAKYELAEPFESDSLRDSLIRSVERLRIKLEEAGGIDNSVIKEYEGVREREAFLSRELEDLGKAGKNLGDLMAGLKVELETRFERGLEKINHEFSGIFKDIFGGGKASLVYIKPSKKTNEDGEEEERNGGLDIAIDMPRKRIRSLDMLSGGERALTSITLLFAMSAVNPPPFLVLDETDAALDEANSQRYGDLLEHLSKKTQLLVVTHNRETMRRCGVLYGVTQSEDATSRILSLKFEDAEELVASQ